MSRYCESGAGPEQSDYATTGRFHSRFLSPKRTRWRGNVGGLRTLAAQDLEAGNDEENN